MCGIAGVVRRDARADSDVVVRTMLGTIGHRGPDEQGVLSLDTATLGACRLAVIDLQGGHQPMGNEDGTIIAAQNGEIYNFAALRAELEAAGHRFRTRSDTEILPHGYEQWGTAVVERLRGMFAIAIWDTRRRELFLARDRFGKKPLFYAVGSGVFVFASEIQAILAQGEIDRGVDDVAIDEYLTFGYIPAPRTAFAAIKKLPPAHRLVVRSGEPSEPERYWTLPFAPKLRISREEAEEELRRRIDEAVRVRLISDVPIGAFLSGGLDSSTVVAYMARNSAQPVKTFSIGFADHAWDETSYARTVANAFGTDHHELVVDASDTADLPRLVRNLGEPFADSSIVPSYQVAKLTRAHVTVALNGDGGDELFAGYDRYKAAAIARLTFERLPGGIRQGLAAIAQDLPLSASAPRVLLRGRRFVAALGQAPEDRFLRWTGYFTGDLHRRIVGQRLAPLNPPVAALLEEAARLSGAVDAAERYMASDILMNLPYDLLVKMDIATMAASLEARSPLLDHELAEFVARLPASFKLSPFTSKILLRRAMRGVLPPRILTRGKMGFSAPVRSWLRGPLKAFFEELVLHGRAVEDGYVDQHTIRTLFDEHIDGRADRTIWLWNLLMLELWFREVLPRPLTAPVVAASVGLSSGGLSA